MGEPYAHPEVLVSADWVEAHLKDPKVRIVESDEDILLYDLAHIPGAVRIDYRPVHAYTMTNDVAYIPPKARVY